MLPNTLNATNNAIEMNEKCPICGHHIYKRRFTFDKYMVQCLNWECSKDHQIQRIIKVKKERNNEKTTV